MEGLKKVTKYLIIQYLNDFNIAEIVADFESKTKAEKVVLKFKKKAKHKNDKIEYFIRKITVNKVVSTINKNLKEKF